MDDPISDAFDLSSHFLVQAVQLVPASKWTAPGLGSWTVRELVGHANRAHTTVVDYLSRPPSSEPPGEGYFRDEAITQRGRAAVALLGDDPAATIAAISEEVIALVGRTSLDATIASPSGTTTLRGYLPSRIAELTIHGLDIVHAVGAELAVPAPALVESLAFATASSVRRGHGELVLLALSGRAELPVGYSIY